MQLETKSEYTIDLKDGKLEEKIGGLWFNHFLDESSSLRIRIVGQPVELHQLTLAKLPKEVAFSWAGKQLFKGYLASFQTHPSKIDLIFRDKLAVTEKTTFNSFFKQQTLQDCLKKILSPTQLASEFLGDFSTVMPGMREGGASSLERLKSLSDQYGFYFSVQSPLSQVVFLKVGQQTSSIEIDAEKKISQMQGEHASHSTYKKVHFRAFDPKTMDASESTLTSQDLYSSLNQYTEFSGFHQKMDWALAQGEYEMSSPSSKLLKDALAKRAMLQERMVFQMYEPLAQPGDKIKISNSKIGNITNGNYFVVGSQIEITSSVPKISLCAVRP